MMYVRLQHDETQGDKVHRIDLEEEKASYEPYVFLTLLFDLWFTAGAGVLTGELV